MLVSVLLVLWRQANCRKNSVNQHRNSGDRNDITEQGVKRFERIAGEFGHARRNAIMRAHPGPRVSAELANICEPLEIAVRTVKKMYNK
jgi:hypothetical protein